MTYLRSLNFAITLIMTLLALIMIQVCLGTQAIAREEKFITGSGAISVTSATTASTDTFFGACASGADFEG